MAKEYPHVQFRPQPSVLEALEARASSRVERNGIAHRDLERYYFMLRASTPRFRRNEAALLLDALNSHYTEPHTAQLLWALVSDAIEDERLAEKWDVSGPVLVERLRNLSPFEALAVADAAERAWRLTGNGVNLDEALRRVGLIREANPEEVGP
jgi:hypothetical protein